MVSSLLAQSIKIRSHSLGCHQNHRQNMPRRRQSGQDVSRDLNIEAARPSPYHQTLRGDGVEDLHLLGNGARGRWGNFRPPGHAWTNEGRRGGAGVFTNRLGSGLLSPERGCSS